MILAFQELVNPELTRMTANYWNRQEQFALDEKITGEIGGQFKFQHAGYQTIPPELLKIGGTDHNLIMQRKF